MKKTLLFVLGAFFGVLSKGQTCNFDQPDWGYSIQSSGTYSLTNTSPLEPPNSLYGIQGSYALISSGGTTTLTLDSVNTFQSPGAMISFSFGASATQGSGRGMDQSSDYLSCQYKQKNNSTWTELMRVRGYRNALWDINASSLYLTAVFNTPIEFIPEEGGIQLGRVVNRCTIDNLPMDSALAIRFVLRSDRVNEVWSLDNIQLVRPNQWLNSQGDYSATNPLNWSDQALPDSSSTIYIDKTVPLWNQGMVYCQKLITQSHDTLDLRGAHILAGEWANIEGVCYADSGLQLTNAMGTGEITIHSGEVRGDLGIKATFPFRSGWSHLSSPLKSTWGDILANVTRVNYGNNSTTSLFAWDATNVNWYGLSDGSHSTRNLPIVIYTGVGWIDSSDVIDFSGSILSSDSAILFYGVPNSSSPFPTASGNEGWNLVGNPFPFTVDLRSLFSDVDFPTVCNPTAYIWDTELGGYKSYNLNTGGINGGMAHLPPWQAMWLQLNSDPGIPVPVLFKSEHSSFVQGAELSKRSKGELDLQIQSSGQIRRLRIVDKIGASILWENRFDHYQRSKRDFEAFFLIQDARGLNREVALKSLDPNHSGGIPLIIDAKSNQRVVISAKNPTSEWWLRNESTGMWTNLSSSDHKYWSNGSSAEFTLWRSKDLGLDEKTSEEACQIPQRVDARFVAPDNARWQLVDLSGRVVLNFENSVLAPDLTPGLYVWRSGVCVKRVLILI